APGVDAASYGITPAEQAARADRVAQLRELLAKNQLVRATRDDAPATVAVAAPAESSARGERPQRERDAAAPANPPAASPPVPSAQAGFDRFAEQQAAGAAFSRDTAAREVLTATLRSLDENKLAAEERQKRVEQALVAEPAAQDVAALADANEQESATKAEVAVRTFASEIDPFELGVLDTGHLVLFRNVWREGQRYVQGALLDRETFVAAAVEMPYRASSLGSASHLHVAFRGRVLDRFAADASAYSAYSSAAGDLAGTVLYRARLSPPFGDVELTFLVDALPRAPGAGLLAWIAVTIAIVLVGGFYLMYRFGAGQMRLARQQQDFVSAVSHELKTPLTSIRMYGEMLKSGWADEAKRQTYYDYIHSESERLSRLIENVLQLARLTRNTQRFDPKAVTVAELVDVARSKVATQVERAGFELVVRNETPEGTSVVVDVDCAAQIFINLVDNALKFSANAPVKKVEITARRNTDGTVLLTVRDYGPGVPKTQLKKIFELFYRAENELTRETVGTGIGLALVRQLAAAMGARVDARNCEPGAEFRVEFPPH
ncbi:MAG TPA: HAMP domain-containing sensor histidine kinase, partial [Gammaproteobacteria bacterium]|nr:HAMP domain-containing sensor histidine kinase [Gammaproteobacteria bacterium]